MSSLKKYDTPNTPDINDIVSVIGHHIFSFLPLGSLLNGEHSPILVNRTFHDGIFISLGQFEILDFSKCRRFRKMNDDQLIALIRKIVEITEASALDNNDRRDHDQQGMMNIQRRLYNYGCSVAISSQSTTLPLTHIDFSYCQYLTGKSIHYFLRHTPNVKQLLLSSTTRFLDATQLKSLFLNDGHSRYLGKLEFIAMLQFISVITPYNLLHLNLSGLGNVITDDTAIPIAICCTRLERLNLEHATAITEYGVGLIAYACRDTLKGLTLGGCEGVKLPMLLLATCHDIMQLRAGLALVPPTFVGNSDALLRSVYIVSIRESMSDMMNEYDIESINKSQQFFDRFENVVNRQNHSVGKYPHIFGKLEMLDISYIQSESVTGCLSIIAWLSGGRLRDVSFEGNDISPSDLSVILTTSQDRLLSINASNIIFFPDPASFPSIFASETISELSLCSYQNFQEDTEMSSLPNLKILELDESNIHGSTLHSLLAKSKRLLRLSVRGCSNLESHHFLLQNKPSPNLLDLDCTDVVMSIPESQLLDAYPSLLRLNDQHTALGITMLKLFRSSYMWRIKEHYKGAQAETQEQLVLEECDLITNKVTSKNINNCCTIFQTGFSCSEDTMQEMYACKTCAISLSRFICLNCVKTCHRGHDVHRMGTSTGYCDCCVLFSCQSFVTS